MISILCLAGTDHCYIHHDKGITTQHFIPTDVRGSRKMFWRTVNPQGS
jgi:hypothetical protein